jgi:hypothetical protein
MNLINVRVESRTYIGRHQYCDRRPTAVLRCNGAAAGRLRETQHAHLPNAGSRFT